MIANRPVRVLIWLVATVLACSVSAVPVAAEEAPPLPAAPVDVTATRLTRFAIEISFTPGAGGGPVEGFSGDCLRVDNYGSSYFNGTSSPLTDHHRTAGGTWKCRVHARNAAGWGPYSSWSAPVTLWSQPAGYVTFTEPPAFSSLTEARVTFRWTEPYDWARADDFRVECSSTNGGVTRARVVPAKSWTTVQPPVTVSRLTPGAAYRCRIRADNQYGSSEWSVYRDVVGRVVVPAAPTDVSAQVDGPSEVTVSFVPGTWGGDTDQVDHFVADCRSSDAGTARARAGVASPIVVGRLDPGRTYRCRVRGVNDLGNGAWSAYTDAFVLPTNLSG